MLAERNPRKGHSLVLYDFLVLYGSSNSFLSGFIDSEASLFKQQMK